MNSRTLNTNITNIRFKNNHIVYENFIKCTIKEYEFNLSYNPTLLSGSQAVLVPYSSSINSNVFYNVTSSRYFGILKDFTTGSISGSEFSPYVATIGLYNDAQELLAIAKMSIPTPISPNSDMTFLIKYDTQWVPKPYFTPSSTPSVTPTITPSVSVTPSITPSVTPSISITPSTPPSVSVTPSITLSPSVSVSTTPSVSVTPSISITPSVTPSISITPSISPSPSAPSGQLFVYGKYINSSDELGYTLNSGPYLGIGYPTSTCQYMAVINGVSNGDQFVFSTLLSRAISGDTSDCPVGAGSCTYSYTFTGTGANYVYITMDGNDAC